MMQHSLYEDVFNTTLLNVPSTRPTFLLNGARYRSSEARKQADALSRALYDAEARIIRAPSFSSPLSVDMDRGNFILVERGAQRLAFGGKYRCPRREADLRLRCQTLERLGFEIAGQSAFPMDSCDVVILPGGRDALLGYGAHSTREAATGLAKFLGGDVVGLHLSDTALSSLSSSVFVLQSGVVLACQDAMDALSWKKLKLHPSITEVVPVSRIAALACASTFIEIGDTVILGGRSPELCSILKSLNKHCVCVPLDKIQMETGRAVSLVERIFEQAPTQTPVYYSKPASKFGALQTQMIC